MPVELSIPLSYPTINIVKYSKAPRSGYYRSDYQSFVFAPGIQDRSQQQILGSARLFLVCFCSRGSESPSMLHYGSTSMISRTVFFSNTELFP